MQGRVLVFFALVAAALASQSYSVYSLTDSITYTGSLDIQSSSDDGYDVELFSFWVPENASSVNITFANLDSSACSYVSLFVKQGGLPCNNDEYSIGTYRCGQGDDLGNGISSSLSTLFVAGNYDYLFEYQVNTYWYIAIGRYYSSDYDTVCPYSVVVAVNSSCPTGTVGLPYALSSYYYSQCSAAYTNVATFPATYSVMADETSYPVFKINVPTSTGNFKFTVNCTSTDLYVYGRSYSAPSDSSYNCYEGSYTTVGTYYIYDVTCYTPRSGDFFIVLTNSYEPYNATITFTAPTVCPAGSGGWNCSFPSVPYANATSFTFTIPYTGSSSDYLSYPFYYVYLDIPANFSAGDAVVTASSSGSSEFYYRRNGYPEDSSYYGYESTYEYYSTPHTYILNQFDWAIAGQIVFGVSCYTSPSCAITVSVNATSTSGVTSISGVSTTTTGVSSASTTTTTTATGVSTTTTTTGVSTTTTTSGVSTTTTTSTSGASTSTSGAESSPASVVIPSVVFAAVAAFVALF